jgi:hypothetical protein
MWFSTGVASSSISRKPIPSPRVALVSHRFIFINNTTASTVHRNKPMLSVAISNNLSNWFRQALPSGAFWKIGGFGNGRYVLIGGIFASFEESQVLGSNRMDISVYSDDGINWHSGGIVGPARRFTYFEPQITNNSILYGNGKFVAPSGSGIFSSTDGIAWTSSPSPTTSLPDIMQFGNGLFLIKPNLGDTYYTSTDAVSWTTRSLPSFSGAQSGMTSLDFKNGLFLGSTSFKSSSLDLKILKSTDGISWTRISSPPIPSGSSSLSIASVSINDNSTLAFFNGQSNGAYVLNLTNNSWTLSDQQNYNQSRSGFSNNLFFTIGGEGGSQMRISTSPNGIQWTRSSDILPISGSDFIVMIKED